MPASLPAAVLVVVHVAPDNPGLLPTILSRVSKLPVAHAIDGEAVCAGCVYIARPDRYTLIEGLMQHASRHLLEKGDRAGAELFAKRRRAPRRAQLLRNALNEHEAVSLDIVNEDAKP